MWNIFRTCGRDDQQGAVASAWIIKNMKGKKIAIVHDKTTYGQGLADETKKATEQGRREGSPLRGREPRREGLLGARLQDQGVRRRPRLLGRPAHRRRPDRAPDARPGRQGPADGRRRHHLRRVRDRRRPRRRRHADDLRAGSAQASGSQGDRGEVPRQQVRAGSLHALQLRGGRDHQAGRRAGEVARPEEGRRDDQVGQEVQDRDRRNVLRQEGRHHPSGLRHVRLEEGRRAARSPTSRSTTRVPDRTSDQALPRRPPLPGRAF